MRKRYRRGRMAAGLLLWMVSALCMVAVPAVEAQMSVTAVSDTVFHADGTAAVGTVLISWPTFTTAAGDTVPKGTTAVTLGAGGSLSVSLAVNVGATPAGTYYTVVYRLHDGTVSREYWSVPVSALPVKLATVRTGVLPTSIAMQTVTKQYVDQAIARASFGGVSGLAPSATVDTTNASNITSGTLSAARLALAGDCVVAVTGVITCTRTGGVAFAASATTDTTNAANIVSGTLPNARVSWAAPGAIGSSAPSAGTFTTLSSTGSYSNSAAGTASSAAALFSGAPYAAGTTTTNYPLLYLNTAGTTPSVWNLGGTYLGVNVGSSFTGDYFRFVKNGVTIASLTNDGNLTTTKVFATNLLNPGSGTYIMLSASTGTPHVASVGWQAPSYAATSVTAGFHEVLYTPASSSASCSAGDFTDDANYHYVCTAANTWKRAALSAF